MAFAVPACDEIKLEVEKHRAMGASCSAKLWQISFPLLSSDVQAENIAVDIAESNKA